MCEFFFSACIYLMTSSGPGCPATAFEGATRRANALVARRIDELMQSACRLRSDTRFVTSFATWQIEKVELSPKMRLNKEHFWRDRIYDYAVKSAAGTDYMKDYWESIFGGIDSHAWRSKATHKHVLSLSSNFLYSREIYHSGQEQFSSAQRAQRKFRVESRRSVAKLALCKEILL